MKDEPKLIEIRCPGCGKLWFKAQGEKMEIEVVCHNCHNTYTFAGFYKGKPVFASRDLKPDGILFIG